VIKSNDILRTITCFNELDYHFAEFIDRLNGESVFELSIAAALASAAIREGNICIDLNICAGTQLETSADNEPITLPELNVWVKLLNKCQVVSSPGEYKPLILDGNNRLYLYRYWEYEQTLAGTLWKKAAGLIPYDNEKRLTDSLNRLFFSNPKSKYDYQKLAAFTALVKRLCVITGGPGTGKTSTVIKILALLLEHNHSLRITLTAPTGKAATRLTESIINNLPNLDCEQSIKDLIPTEAATIHRLLGVSRYSPYFKFNAQNRLTYDIVVVDEASMVDLALMAKLVQALKDEARLILIGDKDQLASVESGAVLGDICGTLNDCGHSENFKEKYNLITGDNMPAQAQAINDSSEFRDCIVELRQNYRFSPASGISKISQIVKTGDSRAAFDLLKNGGFNDIQWSMLPSPENLKNVLRNLIIGNYGDCFKADSPDQAFASFAKFRILCALNDGPYGIVSLNRLVERILYESGLIPSNNRWYRGQPIIITKNDYRTNLFNGDIGIVFPDPNDDSELKAFFPTPDGTMRKFSPIRLPEYEIAYAMTIHKSQGSEFNEALIVLPSKDTPVLTSELIYTGITRARKRIILWANEPVVKSAVERKVRRQSGLSQLLKNYSQ